jgi:hypothetical protein
MDMTIFEDGFEAVQAVITEKTGGGGVQLDPCRMAEAYCGMKKHNVGAIMAYGFRRFGFPRLGWDDYKQLCQWYITTPLEWLYLRVEACQWDPFGYAIKKPFGKRLFRLQNADFWQWHADLKVWAKKYYGVTLDDPLHDSTSYRKFSQIYSQRCPMRDRPSILSLNPFHQEVPPEKPYWLELSENDLERQVCEALCRTIQDLKRPVSVRDWYLTFEGGYTSDEEVMEFWKYDERDKKVYDYSASISRHAGYGVRPEFIGEKKS